MTRKSDAYRDAYENFLSELRSPRKVDHLFAWSRLVARGREWGEDVIDTIAIPPKKAKGVEMAVRVFNRQKPPKDIPSWARDNDQRFQLLLEAGAWPERTEGGDDLFRVGSFTTHNTIGASGKDLAKAVGAIEKAIRGAKSLSSSDFPGFQSMVTGDLYLVGEIGRKSWGAWYMPGKDSIYLRPNVRGLSEEKMARHLVHEIAHRYWLKKLDADFKKRWTRYHNSIRNGIDVSLPKEGEAVPFEVNGKKGVTVHYREKPGKILLKDGDKPIGMTNPMTLIKWMRDNAEMSAYPTNYASTDPEEHFAEALSLLAFGDLDGDGERALNGLLKGEAAGARMASASRVAARYAAARYPVTETRWTWEDGSPVLTLKLKRVGPEQYTTLDGAYTVLKGPRFWFWEHSEDSEINSDEGFLSKRGAVDSLARHLSQ